MNLQEALSTWRTDSTGGRTGDTTETNPSNSRDRNSPPNYEVRALSFLRYTHALNFASFHASDRVDDTAILAVVPAGMDCYLQADGIKSHFLANGHAVGHKTTTPAPNSFAPHELAPSFDAQRAKSWLDFCRANHKGLCSNVPGESVHGLRLIDCNSNVVVPAPPGASYVTLSYVWGSVREAEVSGDGGGAVTANSVGVHRPGSVLQNLPPVISDAIKVAEALGYRYLWVDRYCIDQSDPSDLHDQIGQMDLVYKGSELTIVAAATSSGEDAGLPGVTTLRSTGQVAITIGSFRLLSTLPHPHHTIKQTRWITRGWTFQESVLSRRLLVFTRDQIYFECLSMNCCESLDSPLECLHTRDKRSFRRCVRAGLFTGRDEGTRDVIFGTPFGNFDDTAEDWSYYFKKFLVLVTSYTSRDLTFDSDSIRAFSGALRHMEMGSCSIGHLFGIPYLSPSPSRFNNIADCVVAGLCWRHLSSCWADGVKPRRRETFPSWSWAGWAGAVSWADLFTNDHMDILSLVDNFCCELGDGALLGLLQYAHLRLNKTQDPPDAIALHFSAWLCPPKMITLVETSSGPRWGIAGFEWELHLSCFDGSPRDFLEAISTGLLQCIFIGHGLYNSYFLVLEPQGDSARRVGVGEAQWNQYRTESGLMNDLFSEKVKFDFPKAKFRLV